MYTQENQEPNMLLDDYENLTVHGKAKYESQILKEWGGSASRLTEEEFLLRQIPNLDSNWEKRQSLFVSRHCYKDQWAALDSGDKTYNQVQEEIRSRPRKRSKKVKPVQAEVEPQVTQVKPKREPKAKKAAEATLASLVAKVQRKTKARVKKEAKAERVPEDLIEGANKFFELFIKHSQPEEEDASYRTPPEGIYTLSEQFKDTVRAYLRKDGPIDLNCMPKIDKEITSIGIDIDSILLGFMRRVKKITSPPLRLNFVRASLPFDVISAFNTLGVDPPGGNSISTEDLQRAKSAYKKISLERHPDHLGGTLVEEFLSAQRAYTLIKQYHE